MAGQYFALGKAKRSLEDSPLCLQHEQVILSAAWPCQKSNIQLVPELIFSILNDNFFSNTWCNLPGTGIQNPGFTMYC